MPLQTCRSDGKPGFRWGSSGKCYQYDPDDAASRRRAKAAAVKQGIAIEGSENVRAALAKSSGGLYVCSWLGAALAEELAIDGGEPAEKLHLTLCYLGDLTELSADVPGRAADVVRGIASEYSPLVGRLAGLGVFRNDESDALYASADMPGLNELRAELVGRFRSNGIEIPEVHGFTPHVTLAYLEAGQYVIDHGAFDPVALVLDSLCLVSETDVVEERVDVPLTGVAKDELAVRVLKADRARQIVYGIVLEPEVEDTQGDIVSAEDIELAAHRFLYDRAPLAIQHRALAPETVRPVESYITPDDIYFDTPRGPELVRKGSWVVAAHIKDDVLWRFVESGGFGGWSIAGTGIRRPVVEGAAA